MPLSVYDRLFGSALADVQQRGADFSPDAPWALARSAFPEATRIRPGATLDDIMRDAQRFLMTGSAMPPPPPPPIPPEGPPSAVLLEGTNPSGAPTSNPGAIGQVTGVSGSAISTAADALGMALGLPGMLGAVTSPALNAAKGVTGIPTSKTLGYLGLEDDLTMTTEEGPVPVTAVNMPTDIPTALVALLGLLGIIDVPTPAVVSMIANPNNDPEAMGLINVSSPSPVNAGWTDTTGLTSNDPNQGDISNSGSTPGGGPGGTGTSGGSGPGGAPASGESGTGTGESPYRGGWLKGPRTRERKVPRAHGGEFVVNATAAKKAAPWLEALNAMVPPDREADERFDALLAKARRHLDIDPGTQRS